MDWFPFHVADLSTPKLSAATSSALGAWVRMLANCYRLENSGYFEYCSEYSSRQWMSIAGVDKSEVEEVVSAGLAAWDGANLRVEGFDCEQQVKAKTRSNKAKLAVSVRWSNTPSNTPSNTEERRGEERRREERRGEETQLLIPVPKIDSDGGHSNRGEILEVIAHYRTYHPKSMRSPNPNSLEYRRIRDRLKEGLTVQELKDAIDGFHLSPWHLGKDPKNQTPYLGISLLLRDNDQVLKGIAFKQNPPSASTPLLNRVGARSQFSKNFPAPYAGQPLPIIRSTTDD